METKNNNKIDYFGRNAFFIVLPLTLLVVFLKWWTFSADIETIPVLWFIIAEVAAVGLFILALLQWRRNTQLASALRMYERPKIVEENLRAIADFVQGQEGRRHQTSADGPIYLSAETGSKDEQEEHY